MNNYKLLTLTALLAGGAQAAIIWEIGPDDGTQDGNGDATLGDTTIYNGTSLPGSGVQELGTNVLPGNPANTGGAGATRDIDDDYYFEGDYSTVVDGSGYTPVGVVGTRESFYERAITNGDPNMRFHFNVPASVLPSDILTYTIEFYNLSESTVIPGSAYDLELWVDGTQIGGTQSHTVATINAPISWNFSLADLGGVAQQGAGFDHYVEVRSTSVGNARWASMDYTRLENTPVPEPSATGLALLSLAGLGFVRRRK